LRHLGFPIDESIDVVPAPGERPEWKSDKTPRRAYVAATHRVLLLIGDDFRDFTSEGLGTLAQRDVAVAKHRERWGREWIMIPNPMYGSWERALIGTSDSLTDEEKRRRKLERLDAKE
ncbi:MAG TPA: HAD family acid phosphatase, partial [Thermoanaerobaculia bacterium]